MAPGCTGAKRGLMKRTRFAALIGSLAALVACSSSPPAADASPPVEIKITSPATGDRVVLLPDKDKSLPVGFTVQNMDIAAQGKCNGTATCAHVEAFIDGAACDGPGHDGGIGRDNAESGSSPIKAKFALCSMPTGMHTVRLELHYDDFQPVLDASNQTVADEITVTALAPGVTIISPDAGATVTLGAFPDYALSVDFTLQNFTLMTPGSCPTASQGNCGSIFLLIDGSSCNARTGGVDQGYNDLVLASPGIAKFGQCRTPTGAHTVLLELHNDDQSPLKDASGATLSASVSVTAQ
jgi:hypothetical protein